MSIDQCVGMAVTLLRAGNHLINDESGDDADRYLDCGHGLRLHLNMESYGAILDAIGGKLTRREERDSVAVYRWSQ